MNETIKPLFVDPYDDETLYPPHTDKWSRLVSWIAATDWNGIYSCRPRKGTQQIVINILLHKLYVELQRAGITNFTQQSDFEQFVVECRLVDGRITDNRLHGSTVGGTDPKATTFDDRSRVKGVNTKTPTSTKQLNGVQGGTGRRKRKDEGSKEG